MLRQNTNPILESPQFKAILKLLSFDSALVLDLDNTSVEPLDSFHDLGSDQWFVKLIEYACKLIPDHEEAIAAVIAIYHEVQHHLRMQPVEKPTIVNIIRALQDIGIPVIGLTARDEVLKESTLRQLKEIGIDFHGRIIFCNGKDKGECLEKYLTTHKIKLRHIVMADDKEKHLLHVQKAVEKLGIRFSGVRYSFLDEKIKNVDMPGANAQLLHIKHKLTTTTQQVMEKLQILPQNFFSHHPVSSDFYFEDEINSASNKEKMFQPTIINRKMKQKDHPEQCDNNNDEHHHKRRRNRY